MRPAIRRVVLDGIDPAATAALYQNVGPMSTAIDAPRTLDWPGGGYSFGFKDGADSAASIFRLVDASWFRPISRR
ncbi:MAG: hypothetical protein ACREFO_19325 [Acetobacteraceae bacterium]